MSELWESNFAVLASRWPGVAEAGCVSAAGPCMASSDAERIIAQACPGNICTGPLLIVGGGLALLRVAYGLPCNVSQMPAYRPPIYLLAGSIAALPELATLDCTALLNDPRLQLFVGKDAFAQWRHFQKQNPQIPAAQRSVIVDSTLLRPGESVESAWTQHLAAFNDELQLLETKLDGLTSRMLDDTPPQKLRVLGISSRYTSFIQHSMRDWLDGLRDLGHETEFVIEPFDHELGNPISLARACLAFEPDLIVMIDHYRDELRGLPRNVPFAMWVQDELSHIFCPAAGASQRALDFCLGFGRLHLRDRCGYPEQRFLPTPVGVNANRFTPRNENPLELDCDLAFVSHASAPATTLLESLLSRSDALARKVLIEVFEWLKSVYDAQRCVSHASAITQFIDATMARLGFTLPAPQRQLLDEFFIQRINNALFRHQALHWAAASGLRLQLWGRGWEQHGRLRKFAMGPASNELQLREIYQCSAINLQIIPTGAVHQRLLDGLASGGFFLLRGTAGDRVEPMYASLWRRCEALGIDSSEQIRQSSDAQIAQLLTEIENLLGISPLKLSADLFDVLRLSADSNFCRSAASVWPCYEEVAFDSEKGFIDRVSRFLNDPDSRRRLAGEMRQAVIERFSYASISESLLKMIEQKLQTHRAGRRIAA